MPRVLCSYLRCCAVLLVLLIAGCAHEPTFAEVAKTLPPPPADTARIYVYRYLEFYVEKSWTPIYFNDRYVGASAPGAVFFRDVPAGRYAISAIGRGRYPGEFKTVTVRPGDTVFVRISDFDNLAAGAGGRRNAFVVDIINPARARAEIRSLRYSAGHQTAADTLF